MEILRVFVCRNGLITEALLCDFAPTSSIVASVNSGHLYRSAISQHMGGVVNAHSSLNELTPIKFAPRPEQPLSLTADWKRIGQGAFFKLINYTMLEAGRPDVMLAFPYELVTTDMITLAEPSDVTGQTVEAI